MEREPTVPMADVRQEARRQFEKPQAGPGKGMRSRLAGKGLADQMAILSPRTRGAGPPATPVPSVAPAAPSPATPVPSVAPAAPIPAAPVPESEPAVSSLVGESGGAAPPMPPASLTGGERPLLRQGSSGDAVIELQSLLNQRDEVGQHLAVDGLFGPITATAVRQFQAAHPPLAVDAVVGPLTWGVLDGTSIEPQDATALAKKLFYRGADAYDKGQFAMAYDLFTSAQEHRSDSALVFSRAQCLRRLGGRSDEAIALYEQYIAEGGARSAEAAAFVAELKGPAKTGDDTVDKGSAKDAFQKGSAQYDARDYAHAYDEFTKADRLVHDVALTFDRAQCLRKMGGRAPEAIALYEQCVNEGSPRSPEAQEHLAELRGPQRTGLPEVDIAAAKPIFRKGAELYGAGDYAHAYDEFTKADQLIHDSALTFSRAQCLRNLGARREEAIALFEQYVAEGGARLNEARFYAQELKNQGAISPAKKV